MLFRSAHCRNADYVVELSRLLYGERLHLSKVAFIQSLLQIVGFKSRYNVNSNEYGDHKIDLLGEI